MVDWLTQNVTNEQSLTAVVLASRLIWALIFGGIIAVVYRSTQRREASMSIVLTTTLVLLTILVAMTALVIGDNVARAFSLVGALSIVRFRTVVEDTRDTAFVIFAVVIGMAVGAGHLMVCFIGLPLVTFAAVVLNLWGLRHGDGGIPQHLEVRVGVGMHDPQGVVRDVLGKYTHDARLTSVISARQGAAWDLQYVLRLRDANQMLPVVQALHKLEGVQQVELKEI
jgi:hypothetical protein